MGLIPDADRDKCAKTADALQADREPAVVQRDIIALRARILDDAVHRGRAALDLMVVLVTLAAS